MRQQGKITDWNDTRGFGFVLPDNGDERVFLHINAFERKQRRPVNSDRVTYELRRDERNRPRAVEVRYAGTSSLPAGAVPAMLAVAIFFVFVVAMVLWKCVPFWVPLIYASVSIISFLAYRTDKEKSARGKWRTSENALHFWEFMGGWPGALIAQQTLRHKNRKTAFLLPFWSIVVIHLAFWGWIVTQNPFLVKRLPSAVPAPTAVRPASRGRAAGRHP